MRFTCDHHRNENRRRLKTITRCCIRVISFFIDAVLNICVYILHFLKAIRLFLYPLVLTYLLRTGRNEASATNFLLDLLSLAPFSVFLLPRNPYLITNRVGHSALLTVPNEIILDIVDALPTSADRGAFALTCKATYSLLAPSYTKFSKTKKQIRPQRRDGETPKIKELQFGASGSRNQDIKERIKFLKLLNKRKDPLALFPRNKWYICASCGVMHRMLAEKEWRNKTFSIQEIMQWGSICQPIFEDWYDS
jgi:hypothetical protein